MSNENQVRAALRKQTTGKRGELRRISVAARVDYSNLCNFKNGKLKIKFGPESLARIEAQLSKGKQ
jgi:hypothetical protein